MNSRYPPSKPLINLYLSTKGFAFEEKSLVIFLLSLEFIVKIILFLLSKFAESLVSTTLLSLIKTEPCKFLIKFNSSK